MTARTKNKRSLTLILGFPDAAGANAYDSNGVDLGTVDALDITNVMPGNWSIDRPLPTIIDPLVNGKIPEDGSPMEIDDQPMGGSFDVYKKESTSATRAMLQDILEKTGAAVSNVIRAGGLNSSCAGSPRLHFCLKFHWANPHDLADAHGEIYRQSYLVSASDSSDDNGNKTTYTWSCRRTKLTDNDKY